MKQWYLCFPPTVIIIMILNNGPEESSYHKYCPECVSGLNYWLSYFPAWFADRSYWGSFDPIIPDCWYTRPEFKTDDFTRRKTGLYIPIWEADRFLNDLKHVDREIQHTLLSPEYPIKKYTPISPFQPPFSRSGKFSGTNSRKMYSIIRGKPRIQACLTIRDYPGAENDLF